MNVKAQDDVSFDRAGILLRAAGNPVPMTIAWSDIASLHVAAMKLPDRTLRLVTFVHRCGNGLEITEDAVGFENLIAETCRRFNTGPEVRTTVASLSPGSVLNFDIVK